MNKLFFSLIAGVWLSLSAAAQEPATVSSVQYWIDDNHTSATTGSQTELDIDCSALSPGLHALHYRVCDSRGTYSALQEHYFFKIQPQSAATSIASLQYWWDDKDGDAVIEPYTSEEFILSAASLPIGLHALNYRVKDDAGRWSECKTHYFYHSESTDSAKIASYSYWWNDLKEEVTTTQLETPTATLQIDEDLTVPENAKTSYAGHYTATLHIAVTDTKGCIAYLEADVVYPDNDAPATDIDADKYVSSSTVTLTWVEKTKDKMGDYNVYYSKDGGPFLLWLPDTKLTTATFKGELGSMYLFTVTGRDAFGNREAYDETKNVSVTFE